MALHKYLFVDSLSSFIVVVGRTNPHCFQFYFMKETPEPFPLPAEVSLVKAAAGWAHCVAVTGILDFPTSFDQEIRFYSNE